MSITGSIKQEPRYICVGCRENSSWPADGLRQVHDGYCWCAECWGNLPVTVTGGVRWSDLPEFKPDQPAPVAVPEELKPGELHAQLSIAMNYDDCVTYSNGWNDCRSNMLAAPLAPAVETPASVPYEDHEKALAQELEARDYWAEKATELAQRVGEHFGFDVGEHSNANCPVTTALEADWPAPAPAVDEQSRAECADELDGIAEKLRNLYACKPYGDDVLMCSSQCRDLAYRLRAQQQQGGEPRLVTHGREGVCNAGRDGECNWTRCPQLRDNEPEATGRHCPLDNGDQS